MADALLIFILAIGGLFLAIVWTILPFAIFGIKKRLDTLIELEKTRQVRER